MSELEMYFPSAIAANPSISSSLITVGKTDVMPRFERIMPLIENTGSELALVFIIMLSYAVQADHMDRLIAWGARLTL